MYKNFISAISNPSKKSCSALFTRNLRGRSGPKTLDDNPPSATKLPPILPPHPRKVPVSQSDIRKNYLPQRDEFVGQQSMVALPEEALAHLASDNPPLLSKQDNLHGSKTPENHTVTADNQHEVLANIVTPYWQMRYSSQIQEKEDKAFNTLKSLKRRLIEVKVPPLPSPQPGLPCPLQPIIPSPEVLQYRNKDEFVVRMGVDGNPKTVGFLTGPAHLANSVCVPPSCLINIKDSHKLVCKHFEAFIRQSPHPSCLHFTNSPGVWQSIVVRSNGEGELMAMVVIHPYTLTEEEISTIEEELCNYFTKGEGSEAQISSLVLQVCPRTHCPPDEAPYRLLFGKGFITDYIGNLKLNLTPHTYFPVNVQAAEKFYAAMREVCELSSLSTVLDISTNAGGITGLLMAKDVRGVISLLPSLHDVEGAKNNASLNQISNITFVPGQPQQVLPHLSSDLMSSSDLITVVNTGRGGLHPKALTLIRRIPGISRLLLLSSKPEGMALSNAVSLGNNFSEKKHKSPPTAPFVPRFAFAVDASPHTSQYDLAILFDRYQQ